MLISRRHLSVLDGELEPGRYIFRNRDCRRGRYIHHPQGGRRTTPSGFHQAWFQLITYMRLQGAANSLQILYREASDRLGGIHLAAFLQSELVQPQYPDKRARFLDAFEVSDRTAMA